MGEAYVSRVARGEDAASARWAALGGSYAADAEMGGADSARWSAVGEAYVSRVARGEEAASARWAALGGN